MQNKFNLLLLFLFIFSSIQAQNSEVLFTINNKEVYLKEFERAFSKNNKSLISDNKDSTRLFFEHFIQFKIKVEEAKKLNLDKDKEFVNKIKEFKTQLLQSYIADKKTLEDLSQQVYDRMKTEVHIRSILVKVSKNAEPKDTLLAYHKALNIRKKLVNGENFSKLAMEVSDDHNAAKNCGDLWYIGPFDLPYSVENYVYGTPEGKYSLPIRTDQGYFIVEVLDKRPSIGYLKVAHIMINYPQDTSKEERLKAKKKIDEIYKKLKNGEDFSKLVLENSEDYSKSQNAGELQWFGTGEMPHEFEKACIELNSIGQYSKPVETNYGWHIIKLIGKKELPSYEKIKEQINKTVLNSDRGKIVREKSLQQIKRKYDFVDYRAITSIMQIVDSTIFDASWKCVNCPDFDAKIFQFANRSYYQKDFINYLENKQVKMFPVSISKYIENIYNQFIEDVLFDYETEQVEKNNKQINLQLEDLEEELLANDLTEKELWMKLSKDESGLSDFYNKNKAEYNKSFEADVSIFTYKGEIKKVEKQFRKLKKQGTPEQEIVSKMKTGVDRNFNLEQKTVKEENQDKLIDEIFKKFRSGNFEKDEKLFIFENEKKMVWLNSEIRHTNKSLGEIRNIVFNDYKKKAEGIWIQKLRKNYQIEINESVFESIFNN